MSDLINNIMKIDGRKKEQYFKNINGLNDVYVWKTAKNIYSIGINGTSHHFGNMQKHKAEVMITSLIFKKY